MARQKRIEFFKSSHVTWKQGIHLQKALWHSCMQWGWPAIRSGQRLERYSEYWVFHICWRRFGVCWHWYKKDLGRASP